MEEAEFEPQHYIVADDYFLTFQNRRRRFHSGREPEGIAGDRPIEGRAWRRYRDLMSRQTPWERAEVLREEMEAAGHSNIRAYAREAGKDFSRVARTLQILRLPQKVLDRLRIHQGSPAVRRHFTERRLRAAADEADAAGLLAEIEQVAAQQLPAARGSDRTNGWCGSLSG